MNRLTNPYRLHRPLFHPSNVLHRGSPRHLEDLLQLVRFLLELALQHLRLVLLFLLRTVRVGCPCMVSNSFMC